ncbi:Uncharacterized protein SCF082_LOCUS43047 [Durusdinium trenchii]|uniref:Uncharacterized protein n=1 Tax=Durusdinium trenchii TaxID=1381693 RepID=A0ABP0QSV5_9DINO
MVLRGLAAPAVVGALAVDTAETFSIHHKSLDGIQAGSRHAPLPGDPSQEHRGQFPVKINELFLKAFYAPSAWRKMTETTQQHIVRRDQLRVSEARGGPTGGVPDHIRAMMLLLFAGLDDKEQPNVVPSCGNDYDVKNISHVLSGKSKLHIRLLRRRDPRHLMELAEALAAAIQNKTRKNSFPFKAHGEMSLGGLAPRAGRTEESKVREFGRGLFYHATDGNLTHILITQMGDLYFAGEGDKYEATVASMEKGIHLKGEEKKRVWEEHHPAERQRRDRPA